MRKTIGINVKKKENNTRSHSFLFHRQEYKLSDYLSLQRGWNCGGDLDGSPEIKIINSIWMDASQGTILNLSVGYFPVGMNDPKSGLRNWINSYFIVAFVIPVLHVSLASGLNDVFFVILQLSQGKGISVSWRSTLNLFAHLKKYDKPWH